jgi:predicted alpha/beta-fold hydrolase
VAGDPLLLGYAAPWWLRGGHAQTIYASLFAPRPRVAFRRERWETPDGDFIDLDFVEHRDRVSGVGGRGQSTLTSNEPPENAPLLVLFHGLEGSSRSHYAAALMAAARDIGWRSVVVHFRGCSGEPNRLARAYHSGDASEIDWIARRLRERSPGAPLFVAGVSLGGNALLKWLGESGANASGVVERAAAVSAPLDLMISGDALGAGFNRFYAWHFLATLKPKALAKHALHPELLDTARIRAARTLRAFDDAVTAPLHGFRDTDDYWTRASSKPGLAAIRVPTLVLNARNDPFLPRAALPKAHEVGPAVTLEQPEEGGHCAFVSGPFPGNLEWLPARLLGFFRRAPAVLP